MYGFHNSGPGDAHNKQYIQHCTAASAKFIFMLHQVSSCKCHQYFNCDENTICLSHCAVLGPSLQYGCPPLAVDDDRVEWVFFTQVKQLTWEWTTDTQQRGSLSTAATQCLGRLCYCYALTNASGFVEILIRKQAHWNCFGSNLWCTGVQCGKCCLWAFSHLTNT